MPASPSRFPVPATPLRRLTLEEACAVLARGGIVIYPTETLYAIGCRADKARACASIHALKGRPAASPLPLLAADRAQAARAVDLAAAPGGLTEEFWPGPLSLLLPATPCVAAGARNAAGLAAIRVTPHPLARRLAALAGFALTASSANFSGAPPAARAPDLDPGLLAALAQAGGDTGLLLPESPADEPRGGAPSTLAKPLPGPEGPVLRLLREGAVSARALESAGFPVLAEGAAPAYHFASPRSRP